MMGVWDVEGTDEFADWFGTLTSEQQEALDDRVKLLADRGPSLGRPTVDRVQASRHHNMKELRASREGALRLLFMFDPRRQVILLLGGDKTGEWSSWYEWAIPAADTLYDDYLKELEREGLI
jgi:hypothetical protein